MRQEDEATKLQCETLSQNKQTYKGKPGVVLLAWNSSIVGAQAGVQDHLGLHSKFEACLRCMGPCLKTEQQRTITIDHAW